jgi:DeoR/GlpR family transcriptional regulator of sugar metabolism
MAENSDTIVCLVTSSALGKLFPIQACRPQLITYLVTELASLDTLLDAYRASGMIVF